jgi:hypothetical protein
VAEKQLETVEVGEIEEEKDTEHAATMEKRRNGKAQPLQDIDLYPHLSKDNAQIVEESKIKYVCDALTYKVLSNVKKQSFLGEWVEKRLRQGRMYMDGKYNNRPTSLWKQWKGVVTSNLDKSKVDHNNFRHMDLRDRVAFREIIRDSARGYAEL